MYQHPHPWPTAAPQPQPGEATTFDARFHDTQYYSEARQPGVAGSQAGPARYAAHPGAAGGTGYEHMGVHPMPTANQSQYMGAQSQFMPGPGSINPHPAYGGWPPERTDHVAIGGLSRSHLMPGSYVQSNEMPAYIVCPYCRQSILTKVKTKTGARTVVAAAAIFAVYWPLAFIPFVAKPLKKKVHVCTRCGHKIGKVVTVTPA
ncbi:hypothetical protein H4R19_005920 [Coemansia spiralis]|nr:hypothetical protein H4R19_005920 [Coemansia spiralis]